MNFGKKIRDLSYNNNDWEGESSALLEIVNTPAVHYEDISFAAYRINKYYSESSANDDLSKSYLIQAVINKMESRINEAGAVDCSRLAWLFLNLQNEQNALKYARLGLRKDDSNQHCQKLVNKLSI